MSSKREINGKRHIMKQNISDLCHIASQTTTNSNMK